MKTRAEIEKLKQEWLKDPCYDLTNTEGTVPGFEEYLDELRQFEQETKLRWLSEAETRRDLLVRLGSQSARPWFSDGEGNPVLGLTKREEIAARIMAGFAAAPEEEDMPGELFQDAISRYARAAVAWTDALLLALQQLPK